MQSPALQSESTARFAPGTRLDSLDLARGAAILAILAANIPHFSGPADVWTTPAGIRSPADHLVVLLTRVFIDTKFISLLAVLFGAGLAIQADRSRAEGAGFDGYYARRMALLFGLGILHGLFLWHGDILASYGVVGLGALLLSRLAQRALFWCAVCIIGAAYAGTVLLTLLVGAIEVAGLVPQGRPPAAAAPPRIEPLPGHAAESAAQGADTAPAVVRLGRQIERYFSPENQVRIYREGRFREILLDRAINLAASACAFWSGIGWYLLACFLVGLHLARRGLFHEPAVHRPLLNRMIRVGAAVGGATGIASVLFHLRMPGSLASYLVTFLGGLPLALAYLALFIRWSESGRARWLRERLQAVGRLALTNYLLQSVLCGLIFYSYGLRQYGSMGRAEAMGVVLLIWILQLTASPLWLRCFSIGPVEWLWRSLARGRSLPFRRK